MSQLTTADIPVLAKAIGEAVAKEIGPRGGGNQNKQPKSRRQEPTPKLDKKDQATLQKALETGNLKDLLENKKFQTILMGSAGDIKDFEQMRQDYARARINRIREEYGAIGAYTEQYEYYTETITDSNGQIEEVVKKRLTAIEGIENEATQTALENHNNITSSFLGNYDHLVGIRNDTFDDFTDAAGNQVTSLRDYFEDAKELTDNYNNIMRGLGTRQMVMMNDMNKEQVVQLAAFPKALKLSTDTIGKLMDRQISTTGKASTKILEEVGAYAESVGNTVGVSYGAMTESIAGIITNVETFGNVQVEEAARIAGTLAQLGVNYQSFGQMVNKFMNFDSAASSMGDLTAAFGIHIDAMEMMMLANEDQDEFMIRMRQTFMDQGIAIEDMNLAQKKLLANTMSMSVRDVENFFQTDRLKTGIESIDKALSETDPSKGFQAGMKQAAKAVSELGATEKDALIVKEKIFDLMTTSANATALAVDSVKSKLQDAIDVGPAVSKFESQMQKMVDSDKLAALLSEQRMHIAAELNIPPESVDTQINKAMEVVKEEGHLGVMSLALFNIDDEGNPREPTGGIIRQGLSMLIGQSTSTGYQAMLDSAAQKGVMSKEDFDKMVKSGALKASGDGNVEGTGFKEVHEDVPPKKTPVPDYIGAPGEIVKMITRSGDEIHPSAKDFVTAMQFPDVQRPNIPQSIDATLAEADELGRQLNANEVDARADAIAQTSAIMLSIGKNMAASAGAATNALNATGVETAKLTQENAKAIEAMSSKFDRLLTVLASPTQMKVDMDGTKVGQVVISKTYAGNEKIVTRGPFTPGAQLSTEGLG